MNENIVNYNEDYPDMVYSPFTAPASIVGPPTLAQTATVIYFNSQLKRRKLDGANVTDLQLVEASVNENKVYLILKTLILVFIYLLYDFKVVGTYAGADVAPAWFGPAIAQALEQALPAALKHALPAALAPLRLDSAQTFNASASLFEHVLRPVPNAAGEDPPAIFPADVQAISHLTGQEINELLAFYGLGVGGTLPVRKRRLAQHMGVRFRFQ